MFYVVNINSITISSPMEYDNEFWMDAQLFSSVIIENIVDIRLVKNELTINKLWVETVLKGAIEGGRNSYV